MPKVFRLWTSKSKFTDKNIESKNYIEFDNLLDAHEIAREAYNDIIEDSS